MRTVPPQINPARTGLPSALALAVLLLAGGCGEKEIGKGADDDASVPPTPSSAEELAAERQRLDETVWAIEISAQRYEAAFVNLWDRLRATKDGFAELKRFPFRELSVGTRDPEEDELEMGIRRERFSGEKRTLTPAATAAEIDRLAKSGYRLAQSEWHHAHFEKSAAGAPVSTVNAVLHVENPAQQHRAIVKAKLVVHWSDRESDSGAPLADRIEIAEVQLLHRKGAPAFQSIAALKPDPEPRHMLADPILAHDLDGDGLSEIIVGGYNLLLRNMGNAKFEGSPFIATLPTIFESALLADFNGDARTDFLCVGRDGLLRLYPALGAGFSNEPLVCQAIKLENPMVLTAGDLDHDGDLDLFIGQYKPPYAGGHMPTPYYDANDGLPAYLLENDGEGNFRDITKGSGLEAKRFRRTYAASFVDLDDDSHLDLLVTSDFSGIDLYRGNGRGGFEDVTAKWVKEKHNFGMAHTFGDFDQDGRLDFYVIGMSSTTARRLDRMGLVRDDKPDIHEMRGKMGYGNRMYLGRDRGDRFEEPPFAKTLARTGWSWGCSSFDFDNDGDLDIYVANGHQSGKSARDYCTRFWCHDIYTGSSKPDREVSKLFGDSLGALGRREMSWNGFEHNALLMNRGAEGFVDVGFLMGVALEQDSRAVLSDDFDGDGARDLVVVTNGQSQGGLLVQTLHLLHNQLAQPGNWIGVRLASRRPGRSVLGARVRLITSTGSRVQAVVSGDSLYAQHAPTVHFGLGRESEVTALEVRWPDGTTERIERPEANRYHKLPPAE